MILNENNPLKDASHPTSKSKVQKKYKNAFYKNNKQFSVMFTIQLCLTLCNTPFVTGIPGKSRDIP